MDNQVEAEAVVQNRFRLPKLYKAVTSILPHLRFPDRNDPLFGTLFVIILLVPLAFSLYLPDGFESLKMGVLTGLLGLAVLIWTWRAETTVVYNKILFIFLGGFWLWSIISTLFSIDKLQSLIGYSARLTSSVLFYGLWGVFIVLLLSSLSKERYLFLLKAVVFIGGAIAVFGLVQSTGFANYQGLSPAVRPIIPSFLGNPNFSSMFLAGVFPAALVLAVQARRSKLIYSILCLFIIWAIIVFSSRGTILAVGIEIVLMVGLLLLSKVSKKTIIYLIVAAVVFGSLFVSFYKVYRPDSVNNTINLSDNTVESRFIVWGEALRMIHDQPLVGTGPGNFLIAFQQKHSSALDNDQLFDDAHNIFLHLAAMGGLPLVLLFIGILLTALYYGIRNFRASGDLVALAAIAGVVGLGVSMSFNPVVIAVWVLLAVLLCGLVINDLRSYTFPNVTLWRYARVLLTVKGAVLIVVAVAFIASQYLLYRGIDNYIKGDFAKSIFYLKIAAPLDPTNVQTLSHLGADQIKLGYSDQQIQSTIHHLLWLHPATAPTYQSVGTLYYLWYKQTGKKDYLEQTYSDLAKEQQLAPNSQVFESQAAYMYFKTGHNDLALEHVRKTVILNPHNMYSWILMSIIYQQQGMKNEAIQSLQTAYKLDPQAVYRTLLDKFQQAKDVRSVAVPVHFPDPDI